MRCLQRYKYLNSILIVHIILIINIIILGTIQLLAYKESNPYTFSVINIFCVIWCFLSWNLVTNEKFSPYIIFLLACFLFWSGQTLLYSLNIRAGNFELYYMYSNYELLLATVYTCLGTLFLHLGALINIKIKKRYEIFCVDEINDELLINSIKRVIIPIFFISGIPYIINLLEKISISLTIGYRGIYAETTTSNGIINIINSIEMFFIPSLFILFVVYKRKKKIRYLFIFIILFIFIGYNLVGLRGNAFGILISFIWLYNNQIKKFKTKQIIILILAGLCGLILISVISNFRNINNKNIQGFIDLIKNSIQYSNPIYESIAEFGGSMFPMIETMNILKMSKGFGLGITYIASLLAIVPSILFGGYSFAKQAALATWLKDTLFMNYGPGYSLIAESYYNFGWFGVLAMMIIGYIVITILYPKCKMKNVQILKNTFVAVTIYYLVIYSRSSVLLLARYLFYSVVVLYILIITSFNKKKY